MDLIIGAYAHRLHPDQWTKNAKRVGEGSSPAPAAGPANA
jgi:hypothetical protein